MALGRLGKFLKDHPWSSYTVVYLVLIAVEKLVENDFVCPCRRGYTWAFFSLYLLMPLLICLNIGVYLWISKSWSDSELPEQLKCCPGWCKCIVKFLTCAFPSFFWLALFFGDGRFVACLITQLKEHHLDSNVQPPWEWCDRNRTLTEEQDRVQTTFYISKITVISGISAILLLALICQCCDRRCARSCGRSCDGCYAKCSGECCDESDDECCARSCCRSCCSSCCRSCCRVYVRCCSRDCGGCCCGWCEEYLASRMETLSPSIHTVYCVAKRIVERASIYSVSDGITVYLITLKGDQISKLQEGKTYIIENATVKDDHPVPVMILGNETEVFRTAPLQLDEKLMHKAKESINPSSERAALNDPGLYLKKGYITLTGKVVSVSAPQPIKGDTSVRYIEIEEAGVRVTVLLQKEATTEPLIKGQEIKITHVKVGKNKLTGKKLMSSDYTVISQTEISLINIVGLATKDSNKVLLTEDRQKLNVHSSVWHEDPDQLLQTLPVELEITKRGQEVMQVEKPDSEKMETLCSSVPRIHCVVKRTVQRASKYVISGNSVRVREREDVALCSVSDGTTVYLITLKGDQISKLQEGKTYIIENATVKEDHPVPEMILGDKTTEVSRMAPLQLDEKLIRKAKESISPSSERAALNDPGLYLKKGYITLTGEVVSPSAPRLIQGDIPVRYIVIEEAGVKVTVSLQKESTTEPLIKGQEIKITHVKVSETKLSGKKLMSSDYTVISIAVFSVISIISVIALFYQCCSKCCTGCRMERFPFSVRCVVKRTVQRASKYDFSGDSVRVTEREDVALCSVSDGTTVYLITLKGDQISELQEGETYIINNATVKEDHPVPEMILGNETEVFWMAPLELDKKLIRKVKESINPSSERAALNDPALYLKEGYITLTGKVVSQSAVQQTEGDIPVRDIVNKEGDVNVTLSLQKEAAIEPLQPVQMIRISHLKVDKTSTRRKKLNSSEFTVVVQQQSTDEPETDDEECQASENTPLLKKKPSSSSSTSNMEMQTK